jgi:hypothetical protein
MIETVHNEQVPVAIQRDTCWMVEIDCIQLAVSYFCDAIRLSENKHLQTVILRVSHVQIGVVIDIDTIRLIEPIHRRAGCSCTSNQHRLMCGSITETFDHLMLLTEGTVQRSI